MNNEIVAIYCLCDDILRAMNHRGDTQQQMSDAESLMASLDALQKAELAIGSGK